MTQSLLLFLEHTMFSMWVGRVPAHTAIRDPGRCWLHCLTDTLSGTCGLLVHYWSRFPQQMYALFWKVTCHFQSAAYWSELIM